MLSFWLHNLMMMLTTSITEQVEPLAMWNARTTSREKSKVLRCCIYSESC